MALGYLKHGGLAFDSLVNALHRVGQEVSDIFNYIFSRAWEIMSQDARHLLMVMPFFVESASKAALGAAAGVEGYYLDIAIGQLVEMSLLEINDALEESQRRYSVHPLTLAFAGAKLGEAPEWEREARKRWSNYFVQFADRYIVREQPKERYWNSLLGHYDLTLVNQEKANLLSVLAWVEQKEDHHTLIELMMRWSHYLGRRALLERIHYAHKAAEAANKLGQKMDEALLRIDAHAWPTIEVGHFMDAAREIIRGLHIAENLVSEGIAAEDLVALAYALLVRVSLEQKKDSAEAEIFFGKAKSIQSSPVIQHRVNMAGGDLAYSRGDYLVAISFYEEAVRNSRQYGGEGPTVEAHYPLGKAYLAQGNLEKAEAEFKKILDAAQQFSVLDIAHGQHGLAYVAYEKGDLAQALQLAQETLDTLSRFYTDHRLLKEIEDFLSKLEAG
jgi:LuxR family glucitol operon transcriptional activator